MGAGCLRCPDVMACDQCVPAVMPPFRPGEDYLVRVSYYIHENYTHGVYDSCAGVQNAQTNNPAFGVMCGQWGWYSCTPERSATRCAPVCTLVK